jgi:DNA modification methylase
VILHNGCVAEVVVGDCVESMRRMTCNGTRVQTCVTSPPYFGLRDYGHADQIGLEATPDEFVAAMVKVFGAVRDVMADNGVLWLNLGDTYTRDPKKGDRAKYLGLHKNLKESGCHTASQGRSLAGLKEKDLIGIPWRVAFALQADGWCLRQDIIWAKPNPMPESVRDRCTKSHEYIFMLTKSARYYYDADAIKTPPSEALLVQVADGYAGSSTEQYSSGGAQDASVTKSRIVENARKKVEKQRGHSRRHAGFNARWDALTKTEQQALGVNKRDVWTVATNPYAGAHFATFPPALIEPCILAGSRPGDVVLDPFGGSGTTAGVALKHRRHALLCEINPEYAALVPARVQHILSRP